MPQTKFPERTDRGWALSARDNKTKKALWSPGGPGPTERKQKTRIGKKKKSIKQPKRTNNENQKKRVAMG